MFAITLDNFNEYFLKAGFAFLGKEAGSYSNYEDVLKESGLNEKGNEIVNEAMEYLKAESGTPLLQHKSHIQMLLTMGVRDCPEQVEVYNAVLQAVRSYLEKWEKELCNDYFCGSFGVVDIFVYCCTFNLFRYVMVPTWRDLFPNLTGWRCRCSEQSCLKNTFSNTRIAGWVREGGQIDVRPDPAFVASVAEIAIEKNKNAKKGESQRQREKNQKAIKKAEAVERKPLTGEIEEPANESEKKIFDVLNAEGIQHKTYHHEAAQTVEDVVKYVDQSAGLPTKNLFLKAKKVNGEGDTGLWMVVAAFDTNVDMKKLTSDLKYKSGSLRFADNELLESVLGVKQGHLSLFAKINDVDKKVQVIIDKRLLDAEKVSLHPLINTASTIISKEDFKYFADKYAPGYMVKEF